MQLDENKKIATRMIDCLSEGKLDTTLISSDAQWWVPGGGMMDRATFENILQKFNEARAGKGEMKIVGMTAEDNRVAVEAEANIPLKNGKIYQNTYHFLFIINGGKIVLSKEYNDSLYASSALVGLFCTRGPAGNVKC